MTIAAGVLLFLGVAFDLLGPIGAAAMRDPYQRLHFMAPPSSIGPLFIAVALFLGEPDRQAGLKMLLLLVLLGAVNGVVTHATARAIRVRSGKPFGSLTDEEARAQKEGA